MSKTIIHVNRGVIDGNRKHGRNRSPITKKNGKHNQYAHEFELVNKETGEVFGRVVHRPDKPLACGAKVWIELEDRVALAKARRRKRVQSA